MRGRFVPLLLAGGLLCACRSTPEARTVPSPSPPLEGVGSAYEEAGKTKLAELPPTEYPGLHNVYVLSRNVISGAEPDGDEAFRRLSGMGVKTILSVDGKVPDQESAARYGMRYVHVPIQYSGIPRDELVRIVKAFRELEGPFYVHCFHGKHRGPAAAAVGRLVVDGTGREQAIAEMRQWCGTSAKYEGLYRLVATGEMPTGTETARLEWEFPAAHPLGGFRAAMIEIARHTDNLELLDERGWEPDPEHPDIDPVNEADKIAGLFARAGKLDSVRKAPEEFRDWMRTSVEESGNLHGDLAKLKAGDGSVRGRASKSWRVLRQTCGACHAAYRND